MSKERLKITQPLCVTAKFMLDRGGTVTETAQLLGISQSTLSRIRLAGYNAEEYEKQLEARRAEDQKKREIETRLKNSSPEIKENYGKPIPGFGKPEEDQVPGQIKMDLPSPARQDEILREIREAEQREKTMRFQAAMVEKILGKQAEERRTLEHYGEEIENTLQQFMTKSTDNQDLIMKMMAELGEKVIKLNDAIFQLIRCMRKE